MKNNNQRLLIYKSELKKLIAEVIREEFVTFEGGLGSGIKGHKTNKQSAPSAPSSGETSGKPAIYTKIINFVDSELKRNQNKWDVDFMSSDLRSIKNLLDDNKEDKITSDPVLNKAYQKIRKLVARQ